MRLLAIGDIHGCARALDALLEVLELSYGDTLVTLGDYVDRGPDSRAVLERLIELDERKDISLVPILGNHDQMMRDARQGQAQDWPGGYGIETLSSYGLEGLDAVPERHWSFLARCVDAYESDAHLFVHANAYPDHDLLDNPPYMLRWERFRPGDPPHESGKTLICGHTSQKDGRPLDLGHALCIDTYAHGGGWLTCLDVHTRRVWRADRDGRVEETWLDEVSKRA